MERCRECGGRYDLPGLFGCTEKPHPKPDLSQRIVAAIERDLTDRRGLKSEWEGIDDDTLDDIRAEWSTIIKKELAQS